MAAASLRSNSEQCMCADVYAVPHPGITQNVVDAAQMGLCITRQHPTYHMHAWRRGGNVGRVSTTLCCLSCVKLGLIICTTGSTRKHMPSSVSAAAFPHFRWSAGLMPLSGAESGAMVWSVQGDSGRAMAGPRQVLAAAGTRSCQVSL